jgi:hypothetical protein
LFALKRGKAADLDDFIKRSSPDHLLSLCAKVSPAIGEQP